MRVVVFILLSFLTVPVAFADTFKSKDAAVEMTGRVMEKVAAGDLRGGFDIAAPYAIVPPAELEAMIGQAELQMPIMTSRFGKSIGYELIKNQSVGDSLAEVVYLHRFEKHATVWRFILYRGHDGWVLNTFYFVDDIRTAL